MKNKKGIIIGIITFAIIILATVASLYLFTDLFKNNQQLFYENISKIDLKNNLFLEEYKTIYEKIQNKSSSSTETIDISYSQLDNQTEIADVTNLLSIKSNELNNTLTNQRYKDFHIALGNNNTLVFKIVKDNQTYGLGADNILAKYVAIENNHLKEFAKKLGVENTEEIPDSIAEITLEELFKVNTSTMENIQNTYQTLLYQQLKDAKYYKVVNEDKTVTYGISLTSLEIQQLISEMLKTAKNDTELLNLIQEKGKILGYEELTTVSIQNKIQELLDDIMQTNEEENDDNEFVKFEVISKDKTPIRLRIEANIAEKTESWESTENNHQAKYEILFDFSEDDNIAFWCKKDDTELIKTTICYALNDTTMNYSIEIVPYVDGNAFPINIQGQISNYRTDNIEMNTSIDAKCRENENIKLNFFRNVSLKEDIQITKLTSENSVKLNDMTKEEITQLIDAITKRMLDVYGNDIKSFLSRIYSLRYSSNNTMNESINNAAANESAHVAAMDQSINETVNNATSIGIEIFNSMFTLYNGNDKNASQVKQLIQIVIDNNAASSERKVTINHVSSETELVNFKNTIDSSKTYTIITNYDTKGYVSDITIN